MTTREFIGLTDMVRKEYVGYLERELQVNVNVWAAKIRNHHKPMAWACIGPSVKVLERHAIETCQAAQLYQQAMVKMITVVRRSTQECRLADALCEQMKRQKLNADVEKNFKRQLADNSTQTEDELLDGYTNHALKQKIELLQLQLAERELQEKQPTTTMSDAVDEVEMELAKMFAEEPIDLNAVFGINVDMVMEPKPTAPAEQQIMPSATTTPHLAATQAEAKPKLRNSLWPCELYTQRRRLSACLVRKLDADWRCKDALRSKFDMLFGEDSDDEFSIHESSPSIDLADEVLLSSCMLRIRPWIVNHLMPPLDQGLIANHLLFKTLAKNLARSIVLINPYASEHQVKQVIAHMFCTQARGVQNENDLKTLPPVVLDAFET